MADILTGRFGRYVQALFNLNTPLTLGQALPDVMPTVDLTNPSADVAPFIGNDIAAGVGAQAAVAAEFSQVSLFMPAGTGKLAVVKRIVIAMGATSAYTIHLVSGTPAGAQATTKQFTDARRFNGGGSGSPAGQIITESAAVALTSNIHMGRLLQNTCYTLEIPAVLMQSSGVGTALLVQCETANTSLNASFVWEERIFGPQEASLA